MRKKISLLITFSILIILFYLVLARGIEQGEKNECIAWREQAQEFSDWYATSWQIEQCEARGVPLFVKK